MTNQKKKPRKTSSLIFLFCLFLGLAYSKMDSIREFFQKNVVNPLETFRFEKDHEVIVYIFRSDKKPTISTKTALSDLIAYYSAKVIKSPQSMDEGYDLQIQEIEDSKNRSKIAAGEVIRNVNREFVFDKSVELKEIIKLKSSLQYAVFQLVNKDISQKLSYVSDYHLNLSDASSSITTEMEKFRDGQFLDSEVSKIVKFKALIDRSQTLLNEIYELNKTFYDNYRGYVINPERINDIEMFFLSQPFINENDSTRRIIHYFMGLQCTPTELAKVISKMAQQYHLFSIDDAFGDMEFPSMKEVFEEYRKSKMKILRAISKRNELVHKIEESATSLVYLNDQLRKVQDAKKTIENFATYLIYYNPNVKSKSLSEIADQDAKSEVEGQLNSERIILEMDEKGNFAEKNSTGTRDKMSETLKNNLRINLSKDDLLNYKQDQEIKLKKVIEEESSFVKMIKNLESDQLKIFSELEALVESDIPYQSVGHGRYGLDLAWAKFYSNKPEEAKKLVRISALNDLRPVSQHPVLDYIKQNRYDEAYVYYKRLALSQSEESEDRSVWEARITTDTKIKQNEVYHVNADHFKLFAHEIYGVLFRNNIDYLKV